MADNKDPFSEFAVQEQPEAPADPFAEFATQQAAPVVATAPQKTTDTESVVLEEAKKAGLQGKELAAFMAQTAHESHDFRAMKEYGGGKQSYSGGQRYMGRGPIQLTHDYNYKKFGDKLGIDLLNNPELAADPRIGAQIAVEYWKDQVRPKVSNWDDVFQHSRAINRPSAKSAAEVRGMEDRTAKYQKYSAQLVQPEAPPVAIKAPAPAAAPKKEKDIFEPFRTRKDVEELKKEMQAVVSPEEKKTLDEEAIKQAQATMISGKAEEIRILPSELTALARMHDVPVSSLEGWSSFLGTPEAKRKGIVEEAGEFAKYIGGTLSNMVGLGLPQKLAVETQANPKMRMALEDLRTLADAKRSGLVRAAEFAGGFKVASAGIKAAEVAAKAAKLGAAGTAAAKAGAVAGELVLGGAAQAESGKEAAGAATSLALGGALLGGAKLAGETVGLLRTATAKASKALQDADPQFLEKATAKAGEQFQGVDTILNTSVIRNTSVSGDDLKDAAKLAEKLGPQNVQQIAEHVQQTRPVMVEIVKENLERVGQATPERINQEVARWFTENSVRQIALETFGTKIPYRQGDVLRTIRTVLNKPEDAAAALNRMRVSQVVRSEVRRGNYQKMPEVASSLKRIGDVVVGSRYAAEAIDRRHGTKIVPTLDNMSRKFNEFHAYLRPRAEEVSTLIKNTRAADLSTEDLYQKLDKGGKFGDEAKDAILQSWRKFFSDSADDAGKLGVQIQKRANYVPYAMKPQEELYTTLKEAAEQFRTKHGVDLLNQDLTKEQVKEFKNMKGFESDLLRSLDILSGDPKLKNYQAKLLGVLNDSKTGAINRVISARALERTGNELPSLIRDQDVGRLAQRWLESTFKAGTMRDSIAELRTASQLMRTIGDKRANKYLNNLVADLSGMPRDGGIGRELSQIKSNMAANLADKAMNATGTEKLVYSTVQKFTDAMPLLYNSMYSNALGFSPRQAIANISALATQTIPELGYAFGSKTASKALISVLNDLTYGREIVVKSPAVAKKLGVEVGSTIKTRSMRRWLENEGLASSQWNENIERSIANSMKKSWIGEKSDAVINAYAKVGMAMFEATETIYRVMAVDMAKQVNKSIAKGDAEAGKFLDSLPRSYRKLIDEAKDEATSEKLLTDYIIGKTVYNYNQAAASEIGRSLGPILSSFTKWPTEQLGDALNTFAKNGVTAGGADFLYRRMAPLTALIMLDQLTGWREDPETAFLVTGKKGMQQWAPVNSLASIFGGDVAPPIVSVPAAAAKAAVTADPEAAAKAAMDAGRLFIPGAKVISVINDSIEAFE
jgi:putative chitinase